MFKISEHQVSSAVSSAFWLFCVVPGFPASEFTARRRGAAAPSDSTGNKTVAMRRRLGMVAT
jgi:hypothetical protein